MPVSLMVDIYHMLIVWGILVLVIAIVLVVLVLHILRSWSEVTPETMERLRQ